MTYVYGAIQPEREAAALEANASAVELSKSACLRLAARYDLQAEKAQKDSYARDRAESMARACRECAQEVGR